LCVPADFRQWCHCHVIASHKAQGWTADHVVVAAERLTSKGAYVACSRSRRSCIIHAPRQGAPDRKIARGKSPCGLGCALRNAPEKRVYSQPCQSMEAALHRPNAAPRRAIESAIGGWDAHCAPTKRLTKSIEPPRISPWSDTLRVLPRLKFEAAFIPLHGGSARLQ
jgi:hypothetical protein